jgi:aerobic-type carbon monoxide dehydrogenase small subunit (CoxS/CutS family)
MKCNVNGIPIEVDPKPGEMLSDVLRYRLGLTGTKSVVMRLSVVPVQS